MKQKQTLCGLPAQGLQKSYCVNQIYLMPTEQRRIFSRSQNQVL